MAVYKSSSTLPFGSSILTIANVTYIAERLSVRSPVETFERRDAEGSPNGFVQVDQARTLTATLQLATSTTATPARGAEFTHDSVTYVVGETEEPQEFNDLTKVNINAREKV